jgi:hypothetical protein
MDWLESGVFCVVHFDGCVRKNGYSNRGAVFSMQSVPMDWLESGVFFVVRSDGCVRNNGYSNRGAVFSVQSVPRYNQDN